MESTVKKSITRLFPINIYAFSISFHTSALLTIVVPAALLRLDPAHHTQELSHLAAISAVFAMILPPIIGFWADRVRIRGGRRQTFVWTGGLVNAVGLIGMYNTQSLSLFTASLFLSLLGQSASMAGYQALWSDVVPEDDRGTSAGIQGAATLLGNIGGLGCAGLFGPRQVVLIMAAIMLIGMMLTVWLVREHPLPKATADSSTRRKPHLQMDPSRRRDFLHVFWSQAFVAFGMTLLMTFVLYFFEDVLHVHNASSGTASVAILALCGAVISSIVMGKVSDGGRRRYLVAASGLPMALAAIGFALLQQQSLLFVFGLLFGLGYGTFVSTGWALAIDTLPNPDNVARDLGIWNVASTFPTVIAPLVGGALLSLYPTSPAAGYQLLFIVSGLFLAAGGAVILLMGWNPRSSIWFVPIRLLAAIVVYTYLRCCYTVRVRGRLPFRRPGTLLVSNHLHDLDGMIIPAWLTLQGPWRHPVRYAASSRLFEPGFMSMRFPGLEYVLYRLNLGTFFRNLGVLPIENEPLARPLASLGYDILKLHGDLPLSEAFTDTALQRLISSTAQRFDTREHKAQADIQTHGPQAPSRLTVRQLWSGKLAKAARGAGSIRDLRQPYRAEFKGRHRSVIETQLHDLRHALESGDTLYIAPEGRYSEDGRLQRFRLAFSRLGEVAQARYLAGISYDVFSKRRMRIYVQITEHTRTCSIELQLRAMRPITVGQVLADWLLRLSTTPFTVKDAIGAVESRFASLPEKAKTATPSAHVRARIVRQSVRYMTKCGVLHREGSLYRLGDVRRHRAFPFVEDMLAHQQNIFRETIDALYAYCEIL